MTDLYQEHLYLDSGIMHDRVNQMKAQNLRPEYLDIQAVPSESSDRAYLVAKVRTLTKPFERADVAEDRTEVIVCSCDDFHYNRTKGFENAEIDVTEFGKCKHCRLAYKVENAKSDPNQEQL